MNVSPVRPGLVAATVLCAASVLFGPWAVAVPGGLSLGVVLPGLALTGALFPGGRGCGPASGRDSAGLSGATGGSSEGGKRGSRSVSGERAVSATADGGGSAARAQSAGPPARGKPAADRRRRSGRWATPGRPSRGCGLNGVERIVLPPALSLAVLVTAGLVMYAAGIALNRTSWTAATALVTLAALSVSALPRRHRDPASPTTPANRSEPRPVDPPPRLLCPAGSAAPSARLLLRGDHHEVAPLRPGSGRAAGTVNVPALRAGRRPAADIGRTSTRRVVRQVVPLVLAVVILGAAGVLSLADARHTADVTVTALSATPPQPTGNGQRTVRVTASGLVVADGPYTLVVTGPDGVESIRRTLDAAGNGRWTGDLAVGQGRTTIALYRSLDTTPFRVLHIAAGQP